MNTHMPSLAVSSRCWAEANCGATASVSGILRLRFEIGRVLIRWPCHDRLNVEVVLRRRRRGLPFEPRRIPWIGRRASAEEKGVAEIEHRHQIGDGENY